LIDDTWPSDDGSKRVGQVVPVDVTFGYASDAYDANATLFHGGSLKVRYCFRNVVTATGPTCPRDDLPARGGRLPAVAAAAPKKFAVRLAPLVTFLACDARPLSR
jgi:hypothetical protein